MYILIPIESLIQSRRKEKIRTTPLWAILQAFEIYRALLRANQVGEKRGKFKTL